MFGRKAKKQTPQEPARRQVQRGASMSPAFSYYTSRVSEKPVERPKADKRGERPQSESPVVGAKPRRRFRSVLASVPFWLLLIVVAICVIKLLSLSTNPKIVVVGETATSSSYLRSTPTYQAAVQKLLANDVMNHSKLTVDTEGVSRAFEAEFPELQDVSISIPLASNRPVVYIQPASPTLVLESTQGKYYALNASGLVLTSLPSQLNGVPLAVDQSGLLPVLGKLVLPSSTVSFMQTVCYQFAASHLAINNFSLPANAPYELDVHLIGKPYAIRFNLESAALIQSGAAIATVQQLGSTIPANYIDVRVPGRVYYK